MGTFSVFNTVDKLNNMMRMNNISQIFFGWATAILGRSTKIMELVQIICRWGKELLLSLLRSVEV